MSISFADSVANNSVGKQVNTVNEPAVMAVTAVAADSGEWIKDTAHDYKYYTDYSDENMSTVSDLKTVNVNNNQINLTQESNSQYIPFMMPRYYDGFDLTRAKLQFYFLNKYKQYGIAYPVNVYYNDTHIKFAWLVDNTVTMVAGDIEFEIQAVGRNSKDEQYIWKTKPNKQLNVLQSLAGDSFIEPDESWQTDFMAQVTAEVNKAQSYATRASAYMTQASNYATQTKEYRDEAIEAVESLRDGIEQEVQQEVEEQVSSVVDEKVSNSINVYKEQVEVQLDELRSDIENLDGLASFDVGYDGSTMTFYNGESVMKEIAINSDPSDEWTLNYTASVDSKINIAKEEMAESLNEYKEVTDSDLESIHLAIDSLPETLKNDYYTIKQTDEKFATKTDMNAVSAVAATNKDNITKLGNRVAEINDAVESIDKSPRLTYDATYDEEYTFTLWEQQGEDESTRTAKSQFKIQGGSGSGGGSSLKITYITPTPYVVTVDGKAELKFNFSGTDASGDEVLEGATTWKVGGRVVAKGVAVAGENSFDITDYLNVGTQKVVLTVTDDAGSLVTKTWTVQKIDVRVESDFNDKLTYPVGAVSFDYTPYGAVSKDIYFILDGEEVGRATTSASGIPMGYTLPEQEHGSHLLEVYMKADINGNPVESNHIYKDIMCVDGTSAVPVIGTVYQNFEARQYDATNIEYTVYDPKTETPTVEIAVDGVVVSTPVLTQPTNIYTFKTDVVGEHTITIKCGETVKTLKATITKLDIEITPVTAGLVFDFNPTGKSNSDADRVWSTDSVAMTVSDNFDWINGGYQLDENGDQYFCIKAGTSAEINYQLFADDAKKNGKEFKLIFKSTNVRKPDAVFLSCVDNTTDTDHIGVVMSVHEANIYAQAGSLNLPYSENDIIEFEFNISKNTEEVPMVMGYEDGVSTRPMVYDDTYNFTQNTPKYISLGSEDCDLHIYRFKVYNTSLTARGVLSNFIADARNAEEMIDRHNRNDIYDENSQLDPDILAEKCPWLRVYKISAPYFTNNKSDKVPNTTIQQIYKNGDPVLDNWTAYNVMHSGQGTSSNNYGAAGRNLDFIMNDSGVDGVSPYFILGDGSQATEITMTRTSVPVAYLNAKVNIASSNNMTNAMLANRFNEFQPYKRPFIRDEGVDTSFIKDTMFFQNCVIFIQETNEDISTHREFADNAYHFYALGNIGDSKKTDSTRKTDINDPYECCVEIMDVELPLSDFPADTMYNAMGYTEDEVTHERTYTWAKDENLGILYEKIDDEYVLTEDTQVNLEKTYYVDILEHDDFSEDFTYGWRYISNKKDSEIVNYCKQKWIEFYRFVTTSTDEEFKAHLGDYMVVDTALYYYLFTTRYCMVDNRSKNLFFHYGKTNEVDSDGNPIRKWDINWGYDMD